MKSYQPIVCQLIRQAGARTVLDVPSGSGWLIRDLNDAAISVDGIDLYESRADGYRNFLQADFDDGIPPSLAKYDAIVSCEGIEHVANPGLILKSIYRHLNPGGTVIITTPNTWHAASRFKMLMRGFYPGFPALAGKIKPGTHMHIMPWSWPQLHLHLKLAGFTDIQLHPCLEDRGTRLFDRLLALPVKVYCRKHKRKAENAEARQFWEAAESPGSLYAQRLVVSAKTPI